MNEHHFLQYSKENTIYSFSEKTLEVTGFYLDKMEVGDTIHIFGWATKPIILEITEIEKRDHKGKFTDERKRINSFFSAKCKLRSDKPVPSPIKQHQVPQ